MQNTEGRRFRIDDVVRLKEKSSARLNHGIGVDEEGTVIGVESHPPQTGPSYRMAVQFPHADVAYIFQSHYELVKAAEE